MVPQQVSFVERSSLSQRVPYQRFHFLVLLFTKPNYLLFSDTALPEEDYVAVDRLLDITESGLVCVSIAIVDDHCMEEEEIFSLSLELVNGPKDDVILGVASATIYILKDRDTYG